MSNKIYYLGLDIGTNSIGWAVTDQNYNIARAKGQDLWGVRKFDEAENAGETRRMKRSARRNLSRRKQRIAYLNEIFQTEINKIDPSFLTRLKESQLYLKDKTTKQKHTLFNDADFTDKDFHAKYKTINHLIVDLIENGTKDVRLLYLAIHKLLKNRGHFLFENLKINSSSDLSESEHELLKNLNESIASIFGDDVVIDFKNENEFLKILKEKTTKNDKKGKLKEFLKLTGSDNISKQKFQIVCALIGSSTKLSAMFNDDEIKTQLEHNDDIKDKFSVDIEDFDDYLDTVLNFVGSDGVELLKNIKKLYDWILLSGILGGHKLVSYGMKEIYDRHKEDLKFLKNYIIKYHTREVYEKLFKVADVKVANYSNYVAHVKRSGKKQRTKKVEQKAFYAYLKKIIENDNNDDVELLRKKIDLETFMPKQVSKVNASIPNQLRKLELELILNKNLANFPFLKDIDEDKVSNADKLLKVCSFRIPYYVGPLNDAHTIDKGGFAWIQKKAGYEKTKVTPWNFDKIVDLQKSNHSFLENLVNDCTYVMGEKVLPKHSLLNAKYVILNTINKIKLNFTPIDISLKQQLFHYLINLKKISRKDIENYFITNGIVKKEDVKSIEGIDVDLNLNVPAYANIVRILGDKISYNNDFNLLEELILWATQSANSKMLFDKISDKYSQRFTKEEIAKLSKLKFADWASLSRKFLSGIKGINKHTGEAYDCIIDALYQTTDNLMQLLSRDYTFTENINSLNDEYVKQHNANDTLWDTINQSYASNKVKRQIWQTMMLASELKKVLEVQPAKVFIEMARGGGKKGERTSSRKNTLLGIYKKHFNNERRDWIKELDLKSESDFRSERLYLYYTQKGLCAYSGEPIGLSNLFNVNLYDIDHIYPQSKIKDDSILKNKVLVKKSENLEKGDGYPINADKRKRMTPIWESWNKADLIEDEKLKRLKRHIPLTIEECQDFINRQLVDTRQSTKIVAKHLEKLFDNSKIVYSKAGNVNQFKQSHRGSILKEDGTLTSDIDHFVKVREVNDLHHAKDAYLNIVVGNVYNTKFGYNASQYFKKNDVKSYNLKYLFKNNLKNAWRVDDNNKSIKIVKQNYNKNTAIITNMVYQQGGKFYGETLQPKTDKKNSLLPIKTSKSFLGGKLTDVSKYGGYTKIVNAYACIIRFTNKNKTITRFEFVPIIVDRQMQQGLITLEEYFNSMHKVNDVKVLYNKIKMKSLFKVDGAFVNFTGTTSGQIKWINASQLILDKHQLNYIKKLYNYEKRFKEAKISDATLLKISEKHDGINKRKNLALYDTLVEKLQKSKVYQNLPGANYTNLLIENKETFNSLDVENQAVVLIEILKLFQTNASTSNLQLIGGAKKCGVLYCNQNLELRKEFKLIKCSPTGLFKKIIDFKKL